MVMVWLLLFEQHLLRPWQGLSLQTQEVFIEILFRVHTWLRNFRTRQTLCVYRNNYNVPQADKASFVWSWHFENLRNYISPPPTSPLRYQANPFNFQWHPICSKPYSNFGISLSKLLALIPPLSILYLFY